MKERALSSATLFSFAASTRAATSMAGLSRKPPASCCAASSDWTSRSSASPSSPTTICRKAAGSRGSWLGLISTGVFLLRPLGLLPLHLQIHPFVHQFPEALVVGHLPLHPLDPFRPHK